MKLKYLVEIDVCDGDYLTPLYGQDIQELIDNDLNQDCEGRWKVKVTRVEPNSQEEYEII